MVRIHRFSPRIFFNAEKPGTGNAAPTVAELTQKVTTLEGQVTTLTTERDGLQTKLTTAEGQVTKLTGERDGLQAKLTAAEGQVTTLTTERDTLKANQKTSEQIARENAARHGAAPAGKAADAAAAGAQDGGELWETYLAADTTEQALMRKDKGTELQKSAKAFDARSKTK